MQMMGSCRSPSPIGKRSRDPEDEVYVDNLHSHKRYLSEIMASSLNGLTVGDNLIDSPPLLYLRDEIMALQYSPMSEDDQAESRPSSPVSPYRPITSTHPATATPQGACKRPSSECEGRFPSSPSDICHSADLRRAALMRSVHIRTHAQDQDTPSHPLLHYTIHHSQYHQQNHQD